MKLDNEYPYKGSRYKLLNLLTDIIKNHQFQDRL